MNDLLTGTRVLDLGRFVAGPYCAKLLADAGADVIHVERPGVGDLSRAYGPFAPGDRERRVSATFAFYNADKRAVTLDFQQAAGQALFWELLDWAEIVVENFRPGVLARHGFAADAIQARCPGLVQVSISNYGQTGPYRDFEGTELTLQAVSGLMDGNGADDAEPLRYPQNLAQAWAGSDAAHAALIAYWGALARGRGQQVDVSIMEAVPSSFYSLFADYQYTGGLQKRGQKDQYPTADGALMARYQSTVPWDEFLLAMDAPELALEPDLAPPLGPVLHADRLAEALSVHTRERPSAEWLDRMLAHEIPAGVLQSPAEVLAFPHLAARHFWDSLATPGGPVAFPGDFYRIGPEPRSPRQRVVPALGAHNAAVYCGLLGHTPDDLARWQAQGVL